MTYVNQAGTSWPKPAPVQAAVREAMTEDTTGWPASFASMHSHVARALGVQDPGRLLLTPGATSALAVGVADHAWTPGDRVLISGLEHHALQRPVDKLAAQGVEVGVVPRATDGPLDLDRLRAELQRGGVRLVAMTAACNVTGELLPVDEVVALAHEHDALCLIDGAQLAGWLPLDLATLGADLLAFAGHKALQAPWGVGGLYVAPHVAMHSPAATCELPQAGAPPVCSTMPGYCDVGSVDRLALAGLCAALDWLDEPAQAGRLARGRRQIERLTTALEATQGIQLHGVRDPERRLPTIAFTHSGQSVAELTARFTDAGIVVGGGLQCAPLAHEHLGTAPGGVVRLSVGPSNTDADIEHVLATLAALEHA